MRRTPPPTAALAGWMLAGLSSCVVGLLAVLALHGTRWSFNAIYSDAGFRTEAVTRFAGSPALADYGYRGLGSYYPPALPWLTGRLADLLGTPGWAAVKPVALVMAFAVPLLAFVFWRRVLPPVAAGVVVLVTGLVGADLVKPDEWLVLSVVVPWWLELTRDLRAPDVRSWPAWAHGLVLGLLMWWHTYFFLPLALATAAGVLLDLVRRRPLPLRPVRVLVVAGVGLLVASPTLAPQVLVRLRGEPSDNLQLRWSPPGFEVPPLPLPVDGVGVLGLVGVAWILLRARRSALAETLGVALLSTYVFVLGGQWLQAYGVTVLPEKADELVMALLAVAGVLGLRDLVARAVVRGARRRTLVLLAVPALALLGLLVLEHARHWVVGKPVQAAHHVRYPDGSWPDGGPPPDPTTTRHPWSVSAVGEGPSVAEVRRAWRDLAGRPMGSGTVVVTTRADLLATTPVHPFTAWKSIYSHPLGRYAQRVALLRRVAACPTSRCAADLLRVNPFDRVDGLVLNETDEGLRLSVTRDRFPDGWVVDPVLFDPALLDGPDFASTRLDGVRVVVLR